MTGGGCSAIERQTMMKKVIRVDAIIPPVPVRKGVGDDDKVQRSCVITASEGTGGGYGALYLEAANRSSAGSR